MGNRLMLSTAALVLAFTGVARAQQTAAAPDTAPAISGWFDLGYRGSSVDGDKARWERYRDLRDGLLTRMDAGKENEKSALRFSAANIGYHDQQYVADYNNYGKLKVTAMWNSTPLNYGYNTLTPWKDQGGNVWTLDAAARTQVQNKAAGVLGIGTNAAAYNQASIYRGLATVFPMQSRRDVMSIGMKYRLTDVAGLNLAFSSTKKSGNQPYGASFAFNDGNELPMTLDNRTNDLTAGFEWARASTGMLRVAWDGSWFKNQFQSLTWDNPLRATNFTNGKLPPLGPYDPSGYSNGNGPAFGRLALPPSNSLNTLSAIGLFKMPGHSTLNGQLSLTTMKQNEELIPWTTNPMIANAAVYAVFPALKSLERSTAEAEVRGINALLNYTTRPNDYFAFDMRYRYNDHQNLTPHFDAVEYVRFDAVPEETGTETEHFNIRRNTFETGATFTMLRNAAIKLGYILDDVKRDGRAFSDMTDYTFRVSVDTYGNQYAMLRGLYENTRRVGNGFSEERIEEGGAQPGLRFYDEADSDRNKGTLILSVTPNEKMELGFSLAAGKDVYKGEGHDFGLLDNTNSAYSVTLAFYPTDAINIGGNFGYEKFSSMQKARNANPFSGVAGRYESWLDPNRDWNLDNDEKVKNAGLYLDLIKAMPNTDIRFSYDYSDSDNAFIHSGPRIQALSTNTALTAGDSKPCAAGLTSCFEALPHVTNTWHQMKVDVKRMFRPKVGVGVGYWYEKFDITDFATRDLADGTPRIDPLGAITTGYGNRPYKGQTGTVRLIFMF
ncbi:MAG: MtrB/PioB family outer membrane beta-barrel protein [Gemmatimonadaceae bacterium]|nr:MtrB/PioB family outer membrane beta-barrel protein [Gemmatimonadaceae bacterium]